MKRLIKHFRRSASPTGLAAPLLALLAGGLLGGCSPGAFFGDGKDKEIENQASYRKVNTSCSGLRLESATLDTATFKSLVKCFNSDGALPELAKLVNVMSERDLSAVVQAINRHVLGNPRILFGLERSFYDLEDKKLLDPLLRNTSKVLGNEKLVTAALGLLKDKSILDSVSGFLGVRYEIGDKNVLRALELIGERIDPSGTLAVLDQGLLVAQSREYPVLRGKILGQSPGNRKLEDLIGNLVRYISEEKKLPIGKRFLDMLLTGDLVKAFDGLVGEDTVTVRANTSKLSAVMKTLLGQDAKIMRDMGLLFGVLADPIECLKGAKSIRSVSRNFLAELVTRTPEAAAEFIVAGSRLDHASISPFCKLRPELDFYYPAVAELAANPAFTATHELLKSLAAVPGTPENPQPLLGLFIDFLADPGASQGGGFQLLLPILSELNERGIWDDLTLLATLPPSQARAELLPDTVRFLTEPSAKLGALSISDVLSSAITRVSAVRVQDFIRSIEESLRSPQDIAAPALASMRAAYFANDAHPYIELFAEFLSQASLNDELFGSLLTLSGSDEFKAFLRSIDRMSQSGQLKDLMGATLTLFHDFGEREKYAIASNTKPTPLLKARHDLISSELAPFQGKAIAATNMLSDCSQVKLTFPLEQYDHPGFNAQLDQMALCMSSGGARPDAAQALAYLRAEKVEDGRTFLAFNIDLLKGLPFQAPQLGYLADAWIGAMDDGRFFRVMDAIPLWTPVLQPLIELIAPVMSANRPELQRIAQFGGKLLRRDDLPLVLRFADDLASAPLKKDPNFVPPPRLDIEKDRLYKWIQNKECDSPQNLDQRARAILGDYADAINNWEVIDGHGRRRWTLDEFYPNIESALQKLAEPASIPQEEHPDSSQKYVVDAVLNLLKYFTLQPGQPKDRFRHYEPKELGEWLYRRSNDYRPITYFFPTEDKPRVRYVNTLDMFELVLVNADYVAPWPFEKNFALEFTALLGSAWGDEPQEIWPKEILEEYQATGQWPLKIAEAVTKLWDSQLQFELIMGYPDIPSCTRVDPSDPYDVPFPKYGISIPTWLPLPGQISTLDLKKSLYNLRQLLPVFQENNPINDHDVGLRVLRDLFFQVNYSNKLENRNPQKGWANNLSLILKLTRMGLTREISRQLRLFPNKDAKLDDFFRGLIGGAVSPEVRRLTRALIVDDPQHELIWKGFARIFDVINASEGIELTEDRKQSLAGKSPAEAQAIRTQWKAEEAAMKQLAFYAFANMPGLKITDPALKSAGGVLGKYRPFLTQHADQVEKLLKSEKTAHFFRTLYESSEQDLKAKLSDLLREALADPHLALDAMAIIQTVGSDKKLRDQLDLYAQKKEALMASGEYQALRIDEIGRQLADFLEERLASSDPQAALSARLLRTYVADRLEAGDLDQVLRLAAKNPDEFYHLLETLGIHARNGDLKDFFGYVRRNLSP